MGRLYFDKKDTVEALNTFKAAIDQHPEAEGPYLALAALYEIKKDTVKAVNVYKKAIEKNIEFLESRKRLKEIYISQKDLDKAIDLYTPLVEQDSTRVGANIEIAILTMQKGDSVEAIRQCESLMETHGHDWRVPFTLGRFYVSTKQFGKAADYFDKTINLKGDLPFVWLLRGVNYMQMDSLDVALDNFKTALQKFPKDPDINYYAGTLLSQKREFRKAVPYLEASLENDTENMQTILALAGVYDELNLF